MKEKWNELSAILAEEEKVSKLNMALGLLSALLSGVIIGFLLCPKRQKTSYYGHSSNNSYADGDCGCMGECCCGEEECCCEDEVDLMEDEDGREQDEKKEKEYVRIK